MTLDGDWFTEVHHDTAFSLRVRRKLHEEQTTFQKIEVYETESFGNLMVIDGCVMLTTRDNFLYHEMMAHPVLFAHENPRDVLIIGGGDCGTLREVLRHESVREAAQVDIDEGVTRASLLYFPELCESNGDQRAALHFEDGVKWVKEAAADSCDVIIIDSTDPVGPAEGLFGEPFLRDCHRALRSGGIIVQQSESPLLHRDSIIAPLHAVMRRAGFTDVRTLPFPQPVYPSGWWSCTMAAKGRRLDSFREEASRNKEFATRYYTSEVHRGALARLPLLDPAA